MMSEYCAVMKILIIGGGSSLAQLLKPILAEFAEVIETCRTGKGPNLDLLWPEDQLVLPSGMDAVINMAAHFGGRDFASILIAEQVNCLGALKVAHACQKAGARHLVHLSTTYAMLAEGDAFYGAYSLSKRHGEELATFYCRTIGLPLTVLRPSQIYGAGAASRKHQPLFYHILDKAESNEDIQFYGSNDALRNLIHAEDVAQVIARVVQERIVGTYTCASFQNVRCSEVARAAIKAFGSSSSISFLVDKPDIPDNPFDVDDTLYQQLGWFPCISLEEGMFKEVAKKSEGGR